MQIVKLYIHRDNVGTHKSPIIVKDIEAANKLFEFAKEARQQYIIKYGNDYDGEITCTTELVEVLTAYENPTKSKEIG
jgi:hypothetical protein